MASDTRTKALIQAECNRRFRPMLDAYSALTEVSAEDRKIIDKWLALGRINQRELGRLIAQHRREHLALQSVNESVAVAPAREHPIISGNRRAKRRVPKREQHRHR